MNNGLSEQDFLDLSSTYAFLTADRILDRFNLSLKQQELAAALKNPRSVYFQLLFVPFKNIINGIVYQQAYDYQIYAQKLFVDYLVSGAGNDDPEAPGAALREDLDQNRLKLIDMAEQLEKEAFSHKTLINKTQGKLVELVKSLMPIQDSEDLAAGVASTMEPFLEKADELGQRFRKYRVEFKTLIVDVLRLIQLLPNYKENPTQEAENRTALQFDDQLG